MIQKTVIKNNIKNLNMIKNLSIENLENIKKTDVEKMGFEE